MSETNTTPTDDGVWTPDDFAYTVTPALKDAATGEPLSAEAARVALAKQIRALSPAFEGQRSLRHLPWQLAQLIVQGLPADANVNGTSGGQVDEGIIANLDLRPYLQQIIEKPNRRFLERFRGSTDQEMTFDVGDMQALADGLNAEADQVAADVAEASGTSVRNVQFRQGEAGLSPNSRGARALQVGSMGGDVDTAVNAVWTGADSVASINAPTFDESALRQMIDMPPSVFDSVVDAEADFNEAVGTPGMMRSGIQISGGAMPSGMTLPGGQPAQRKLSIYAARGYLARLKPSEVASMQQKMAKAGYFDRVGSNYLDGDADDEATYKAWEMLLVDSYKTNVPVDKLLTGKARTYRAERQQQVEKMMQPIDTQSLQMQGNDAARQLLGRNLSPEEVSELTSHLNKLRIERTGFVTGADDNTTDMGVTTKEGYDEADVAGKMNTMLTPEVGRRNSFDQWQNVNNKLNL